MVWEDASLRAHNAAVSAWLEAHSPAECLSGLSSDEQALILEDECPLSAAYGTIPAVTDCVDAALAAGASVPASDSAPITVVSLEQAAIMDLNTEFNLERLFQYGR